MIFAEKLARHPDFSESLLMTNGNGVQANPAVAPDKKIEPLFVSMDTIKAERVDWLWPHRIPIGRLTLIDGDPGAGKSYLTLGLAAAVSVGATLPGNAHKMTTGNVLLISVEDGFSDTVRPRLDGLKADVSKIVIPNPRRGLAPSLININFIESAVREVGPKLVVIDPVVQFLGRKDADKAGQVREMLAPLMALAERHAFACVIVRHLNKQSNTKAMYRGSGSIDFMAACRSAFVVVEDPDDKSRRILAHVKNSVGPKMPSLAFYIDGSGFRWGDECDTTADDLLSPVDNSRGRERAQLENAKEFLEDALGKSPARSTELKEKAATAGLAWRTVWRAKEELHVKASKERGTGEWF